ncbi:MAG TPA: galactokinase [Pyrinomonadaceae bacterium]|nr:galactokinase [Pyrinomonadaceae bacterium]
MIDPRSLKEKFTKIYGDSDKGGEPRLFRAPGRVNLIGEHTDYNGGFVLPMAIDKEAAVAIRERSDRKIRIYTVNLEDAAEFDLDAGTERKKGFWLNYFEGVARILESKNVRLKGADLVLWSDVPTGAGLSSSAALEIVTGLALSELSGRTVERATLAKIGQQTEHEYVGAKVGIMDQFVSAHARAQHALLLDCRTLEFENVPLDTRGVAVVICDTNVKHDLATSEYNTRRAECEQAVRVLKENLPDIRELRDVSREDFEKYADTLPELIRRRARHVVTENERTLQAANALKRKDLNEFGRLMRLSHESLKNDYEVSCRELDILVEIAGETTGVLGGRMTGGGFGGSTVNLVERENLEGFKEKISAEYERLTGIGTTVLVSDASEGASEIIFNEPGET